MPGTHAVRDRQQYDGNTPNTFCLTHIQLLYGILYTTSSRTSTNTSPITLCKCPELFLVFDNMWSTKHWSRYFVQKNRWLSLTSRTYSLYTTNRQQHARIQHPRHREKPWVHIDTGNYDCCIKIQLLYGILYTNRPSTNTSIACDTPSIKVDAITL